MKRKLTWFVVVVGVLGVSWLCFAPVPIEPVSWEAPEAPPLAGDFAVNQALSEMTLIPLGEHRGAEDLAIGRDGLIYGSVENGIVRFSRDGSWIELWMRLAGRPLGIDFDQAGNLIIADAESGLLSITPDGTLSALATVAGGEAISYANDVDVAADGRIWFSEASVKFAPSEWGGTFEASLLDLMEHGAHGRLLMYDPATGQAEVAADGFQFPNGVAVAHDQQSVLVGECGSYRVMRVWIEGPRAGQREVVIDNLPGFPDNVSAGLDGRYWVALISPRNSIIDGLSGRPSLRKVVQRLPSILRPKAVPYVHVVAFDDEGKVVEDLQDPSGSIPTNSAAVEERGALWLASLTGNAVGRVDR